MSIIALPPFIQIITLTDIAKKTFCYDTLINNPVSYFRSILADISKFTSPERALF